MFRQSSRILSGPDTDPAGTSEVEAPGHLERAAPPNANAIGSPMALEADRLQAGASRSTPSTSGAWDDPQVRGMRRGQAIDAALMRHLAGGPKPRLAGD